MPEGTILLPKTVHEDLREDGVPTASGLNLRIGALGLPFASSWQQSCDFLQTVPGHTEVGIIPARTEALPLDQLNNRQVPLERRLETLHRFQSMLQERYPGTKTIIGSAADYANIMATNPERIRELVGEGVGMQLVATSDTIPNQYHPNHRDRVAVGLNKNGELFFTQLLDREAYSNIVFLPLVVPAESF